MLQPMLGGSRDFYPFKINQSVRINSADSAHFDWTPSVAQDDTTLFCLSAWIKRSNITSNMGFFGGGATTANASDIWLVTDALWTKHEDAGVSKWGWQSDALLRDTSNWYHIFAKFDTDQVTASDRIRFWVNGVEVDDSAGASYPTLGFGLDFLDPSAHYLCRSRIDATTQYFDGYIAEVHALDGIDGAVSDFGQFKNGVWIPKRYAGNYGTNGFYLDFSNSANFGEDQSGNNNDWNALNLAANDQVEDSPTNNYTTLSSINKHDSLTLSNGGLEPAWGAASWLGVFATMGVSNGKWYFEVDLGTDTAGLIVGIVNDSQTSPFGTAFYPGDSDFGWGVYANGTTFDKYHSGVNDGTLTGDSPSANDIIQVAFDADAGKLWFGSNNTWLSSGNPAAGTNEAYSGLTGTLIPAAACNTHSTAVFNFGQLGFAHNPPTGFKALRNKSLPEPSSQALVPSRGFDILLYTGTGANPQAVAGLEFSPDLVWNKSRSNATTNHPVHDKLRGVENVIWPDNASVESNQNAFGYLSAFNSDGFSMKPGATNGVNTQESGYTYVAWCFKESPAFGIDIVAYTGTGVAHAENHSLGAAPELILIKNRDGAQSWGVFHHHAFNKTDPETDYGVLDLANAWADSAVLWNDTAPTSSQFTVGTSALVNANTQNHIAYLFRSIEGFSKVFSYEGNGNANGPVTYLGFRPKYVLIKNADGANNWLILDAARDTYNPCSKQLYPDATNAETTSVTLDILSNGFKLRNTTATINTLNQTYIGIAFAEMPFKYSNAR